MSDLAYLAARPGPGEPHPYHFPRFERHRLDNGLTVISAHVAGRPLMAAQLLLGGGGGHEPVELAGVTTLMAHALSEGTRRLDATAFIEASERLGAELGAEAGWETVTAWLGVPRSHLEPALRLLAEMLLEPAFPEDELERLRAERLNDLLQADAEPRRRVERALVETIYAPAVPYARRLAGDATTVPRLDRAAVTARHAQLLDPRHATLILSGDLEGVEVAALAERVLGAWAPGSDVRPGPLEALPDTPAPEPRVVVVDRPGSPQSEVRVGHVGLPRRIPDFHAVSVMGAILGGLSNSRLQYLLREQRGYTYGVSAGFDLRRSAGPFAVRTAVQTEVTAPAVRDILAELRRVRQDPPTPRELDDARQYLIGVFPLRYETAAAVAAAIAGLVAHELPDDELDRYRPAVAGVTADDVLAAAAHVRPEDASIVLVGDAGRVAAELEAEGLGPVEVVVEAPATGAGAGEG